MEITGKIKKIGETKEYGSNGFRKREWVLETEHEKYPQTILLECIQDKCALLDSLSVGQEVTASININGREWTNPQGEVKYFNSILAWKIESKPLQGQAPLPNVSGDGVNKGQEEDNLPF